jgi:hypothetical protein
MAKLDAKKRNAIGSNVFAFPKERKEPLENAGHVRNAAARFDQVKGVSQSERGSAWKRIKAAAKKFGVELREAGQQEMAKSKHAKASRSIHKKAKSA